MTPQQEQEQLRAALLDKAKQSVASQLVGMALADSHFLRGLDGQTYAVAKEGPSLAQALRGEGSYRRRLAASFYAATGQVANANALSDALMVLDARADEGAPQPVYQRVAPSKNGGVVLDLGRPDHLVVEIDAEGWRCRTLTGSDPLFKRTRQMDPITGTAASSLCCQLIGFVLQLGGALTTAAQLEANRRNALRSTGPRTAQGKGLSSMNATGTASPAGCW